MFKKYLAIFALLALLPAAAMAEQKGGVELLSLAEVEIKVKNEAGEVKIERVPAETANVTPGVMVIFTNRYLNHGDQAAEGIVITNPIPEHMLYVVGSAGGEDARSDFSIDKGKSYDLPENLIVRDSEGKERPARPDDYTHIRWTIEKPVTPAAGGSVEFRARVK